MGGRGGAPMRAQSNAASAAASASPEAQIRQAYNRLAAKPGAWLRLTDLRSAMGDSDTSVVDNALRNLANSGTAEFIPIANLKSLSPQDRQAAIKVGGELKHLIKFEPRRD